MAEFKALRIDRAKLVPALQAYGWQEVMKTYVAGTESHLTGKFEGQNVRCKVFEKGDGTTTISKFSGEDQDAFEKLANHLVESCRWGEKPRLEYSLPKQDAAVFNTLIEALQTAGAVVEDHAEHVGAEVARLRGPSGDRLTVRWFKNGTLQLQGQHAQLASWAVAHLQAAMGLAEVLEQQRKLYSIDLTLTQVRDELVARIPRVHDALPDEVRRQFSSAHAMTKVAIPLEDYAGVAFPALRGLEGFCLHLLRAETGLKPLQKSELGEYFEPAVGAPGQYVMRAAHGAGLHPNLQNLLASCYTLWQAQRHRLFHMDGTIETTRILDDREAAVEIVATVFETMDQGYGRFLEAIP